MQPGIERLIAAGRQAAIQGAWPQVRACAEALRRQAPLAAEGWFLAGLAARAEGRVDDALPVLERAIALDPRRGDAAVELAGLCVASHRYADALALLDRFRDTLSASPYYLDRAGTLYTSMNRHEAAWDLFEAASRLSPDAVDVRMHLAACGIYLGRIDAARALLRGIVDAHPDHQRAHYELAQVTAATDRAHVDEMLRVLEKSPREPTRNIFLYYALGKELEDLGEWDAAFDWYERGGTAARSIAAYDVQDDVALADTVIETCSAEWLAGSATGPVRNDRTPVFIVGLPRTGTTLTERIVSAHSRVESAGETQFLQMVLRGGSRANTPLGITPTQIRDAARRDPQQIATAYLDALSYRLGDAPLFTEKLPENVLYLGFIAKAWPGAPIIHLRRDPMDACFAVFKQSYFRFAYTLDDLAEYYLAYDRLTRHWQSVLGHRVIEVQYEELVADLEGQTRRILKAMRLPFESACLDFAANAAPVATASAAQVRGDVHTRSVGRWRHFAHRLEPLRRRLADAGVELPD